MIIYQIGREYRYPKGKKRYKLKSVYKGWRFHFECGHNVTDNVFLDLIDCKTGIQVCENNQMQLKLK